VKGGADYRGQKAMEKRNINPDHFDIPLFFLVVLGFFNSGLARQVLYHLSHTPSHLLLSYISGRVSWFLPGASLEHGHPTYASLIAGIIGMSYCETLTPFLLT
jgi:hypothetical protein